MKRIFHFPKALRKAKRRAAVILPKDAGAIIAFLEIGKNDTVVEIGAGNGFLTYYLSIIAKEVYTYENNEEQFAILKENIEKLKLNNVHIKFEDGRNANEEGKYIIDAGDAHEIAKCLNNAKSIACYTPNINQTKLCYDVLKKKFKDVFVISMHQIEYKIDEKVLRPYNKQLWHTAYLIFGKQKRD